MDHQPRISLVLQDKLSDLTKTERRIAEYILVNQDRIIYATITDVVEATKSSEATIIRMCRKLGYRGFQDLKISIARDQVPPREKIHESIAANGSPESVLDKSFESTIETLHATRRVADGMEFQRAADAILRTKRMLIYCLAAPPRLPTISRISFCAWGLTPPPIRTTTTR